VNLWQENELCYIGLTVFSIYLLQRLQFLLGGMSDKDREHARIMARLEELEMEEEEAGNTSEEEDDENDGEGAKVRRVRKLRNLEML
jgi:hypothetical protein